MKKREPLILELLAENGRMEVAALADRLETSQVTIRKDLDALEKRGIIRREHGFAVFGGTDDLNNRIAVHYEEKRKIARAAAKLVSPGETVMIENGSCCALFAEELAGANPDVTIITNSAFIASYIRRSGNGSIILLGGDFQKDAQVMVGPILRVCAAQFYVDKLFIGVDGYSETLGFTGKDHLRVQAVRDMAEHADRVFVITESSKFSRHGVVPLSLPKEKPIQVITDQQLSEEKEKTLLQAGIAITKAE
ncbi:MAG: DeoR/GlpR transcriptional regulator [Oscillospiraceae bacterium]|nr:DeoR/GlpR transcriptional regulator [Oscillospiraceae bacterium]